MTHFTNFKRIYCWSNSLAPDTEVHQISAEENKEGVVDRVWSICWYTINSL